MMSTRVDRSEGTASRMEWLIFILGVMGCSYSDALPAPFLSRTKSAPLTRKPFTPARQEARDSKSRSGGVGTASESPRSMRLICGKSEDFMEDEL